MQGRIRGARSLRGLRVKGQPFLRWAVGKFHRLLREFLFAQVGMRNLKKSFQSPSRKSQRSLVSTETASPSQDECCVVTQGNHSQQGNCRVRFREHKSPHGAGPSCQPGAPPTHTHTYPAASSTASTLCLQRSS